LLKVDRFIGISYLIDGKLYGTSILALNMDQIDPPKNILERFISMATVSLRRKQAEEHLRSSEERFRSLASSFNDIIYSLDTQQRHSGVYGNWVENIGLTPEFFLGKTSREIFGAEAALVHEEANQHALAGEPVTYEWSAPAAVGVSYYQTAVSPLRNSQGEIVGIVGVGRDISERRAAEENIRLLNIELEQLALTDYLTNLSNRRYFMQRGAEEFKRAQRNNQPLALMMLDIDEFKKVNDSYGHEAGDQALQQVAAVMKSSLREIDLLGRLGGEEFAVLLPDTSEQDAVVLAERVRQSIANMSFETPGQVLSNPITISIGVAVISDEMSSIDDLLRKADAALYRAKQSGRNRVVVDQGNPDLPPRRE
jgi:diguanylate cyclase (GGDEF)-like protein/PAS domain S-box-containing protein